VNILLFELIGKVVSEVKPTNADEGLVLVFSDGTTLEVGYSGCEGWTKLNGKEIPT
jgi:hypothetical protein